MIPTPKEKAQEALSQYDNMGWETFTISDGRPTRSASLMSHEDRLMCARTSIKYIINDYDKDIEAYKLSNYPGQRKLNWLEEQTKRIYPKSFWLEVLKEL